MNVGDVRVYYDVQENLTGSLGDYAAEIDKGAIIVTNQGQPVAALVPIENADLETASLATNPKFLALIERSRARLRVEGGMRRRLSLEEEGWGDTSNP